MNKKKLVFPTSATDLILFFGAWKANSVNLSSIETEAVNNISIEEPTLQVTATNYMIYASVEKLASKADLIVVGTTKEFEQNKLVYVSVADKSKKTISVKSVYYCI